MESRGRACGWRFEWRRHIEWLAKHRQRLAEHRCCKDDGPNYRSWSGPKPVIYPISIQRKDSNPANHKEASTDIHDQIHGQSNCAQYY